jgi:hypothetical protein
MADNLGYTPGAGASVASDEVGGAHYQRVKIVTGAEGVVEGDVSPENPMPVMGEGELVESLFAIRSALEVLARNTGQAYPDTAGRLRVAIDSISSALTLATITTVGTVTTVTTVTTMTNQVNVGGYSAAPQIQALTQIGAESLRRNISVT